MSGARHLRMRARQLAAHGLNISAEVARQWRAYVLAALCVGCAAYRPPIVFLPLETPKTERIFVKGMPIAVVNNDSARALVALEPFSLSGRDYMRIWLLHFNASSRHVLVEPLNGVVMTRYDSRNGIAQRLTPKAPSRILHRINVKKNIALIAEAIGGSLQAAAAAASVNPTTVTFTGPNGAPSGTAVVNDTQEKASAKTTEISERTRARMEQTEAAFDLYERSVNDGVLRRNTVSAGSGVHGYIYVPISTFVGGRGLHARGRYRNQPPRTMPEDCDHVIALQVPGITDSVRFRPGPGE